MTKYTLPIVLFLVGCSPSHRLDQQPRTTSLTILHWNDFHAQNVPFNVTRKIQAGNDPTDSSTISTMVGGTAALLGYIDSLRHNRTDVSTFYAGDDFQGTPISSITYGRSQIELMNVIAPDAATLGNHEFDYGIDSLRVNIRRAQYPIVCANIFDDSTSATLVPAYTIIAKANTKLGIIGLAPPDLELLTIKKNLQGLSLRMVDNAIDDAIQELRMKHQPDLIIILSHMGIERDTAIATRRNDIDIIVGGHSHIPLFSPMKKNHTIIVQAGSRGQYLGKLDLTVDLAGDSVISYTGELIETKVDAVTLNPAAAEKVKELESAVDASLNEIIGTLVMPWDRRFGQHVESNIGNWECDVVRRATNTDIAFLNSAGTRKNLDAGPIKVRDMWEINPFGNTLTIFTVRGDTLRKMIEWQAGIQTREFLQVSGIKYVYDSSKPNGKKLISLEIGGRTVLDAGLYSIGTNNYVSSHLPGFFGIDEKSVKIEDTGIIDREAFITVIREKKTISSTIDGRSIDISTPK